MGPLKPLRSANDLISLLLPGSCAPNCGQQEDGQGGAGVVSKGLSPLQRVPCAPLLGGTPHVVRGRAWLQRSASTPRLRPSQHNFRAAQQAEQHNTTVFTWLQGKASTSSPLPEYLLYSSAISVYWGVKPAAAREGG